MNTSVGRRLLLERADVLVLLPHLALYGLAAILEDAGLDVRAAFTRGMTPVPWIEADGLDETRLGEIVRAHARARSVDSWVQASVTLAGSERGLMSPRLSGFSNEGVWRNVREKRDVQVERLQATRSWSDLSYLAALGEPAYWSRARNGKTLQDDGASRLEMQPRNQGSEFVGNRLCKLASAVAAREPAAVASGVLGRSIIDEVGRDATDSRTPTGLASPGPTDNALAWCALWGIGQFPTVPRVNRAAVTSGHLGRARDEWFYVPVWSEPWRPSRVRTVLASEQLAVRAGVDLHRRWSAQDDEALEAESWLRARGVAGIVRFPIVRFGSDNAPERRAMRGTVVKLRGVV